MGALPVIVVRAAALTLAVVVVERPTTGEDQVEAGLELAEEVLIVVVALAVRGEAAPARQVVRVEDHVVAAALEGILFDDGSEVLLHESGFGAALELVVAEEASEGLDDCRRANVRVKRPGSEFRFRIHIYLLPRLLCSIYLFIYYYLFMIFCIFIHHTGGDTTKEFDETTTCAVFGGTATWVQNVDAIHPVHVTSLVLGVSSTRSTNLGR